MVTRVTKRFKSPTKVLISKQKANIDIIMKIDALEFRFDNYARYEENIYLQLYIIKTLNHYFWFRLHLFWKIIVSILQMSISSICQILDSLVNSVSILYRYLYRYLRLEPRLRKNFFIKWFKVTSSFKILKFDQISHIRSLVTSQEVVEKRL